MGDFEELTQVIFESILKYHSFSSFVTLTLLNLEWQCMVGSLPGAGAS